MAFDIRGKKTVKHLKWKELRFFWKLIWIMRYLAALSFRKPELVIVFLSWYFVPLKFEFHKKILDGDTVRKGKVVTEDRSCNLLGIMNI